MAKYDTSLLFIQMFRLIWLISFRFKASCAALIQVGTKHLKVVAVNYINDIQWSNDPPVFARPLIKTQFRRLTFSPTSSSVSMPRRFQKAVEVSPLRQSQSWADGNRIHFGASLRRVKGSGVDVAEMCKRSKRRCLHLGIEDALSAEVTIDFWPSQSMLEISQVILSHSNSAFWMPRFPPECTLLWPQSRSPPCEGPRFHESVGLDSDSFPWMLVCYHLSYCYHIIWGMKTLCLSENVEYGIIPVCCACRPAIRSTWNGFSISWKVQSTSPSCTLGRNLCLPSYGSSEELIEVDGWEDRDDITVVVREPKKNEPQKTWKGNHHHQVLSKSLGKTGWSLEDVPQDCIGYVTGNRRAALGGIEEVGEFIAWWDSQVAQGWVFYRILSQEWGTLMFFMNKVWQVHNI